MQFIGAKNVFTQISRENRGAFGPILFALLSLAVCRIIKREPNFPAPIFNSGFSNTGIRPNACIVLNNRSHVPYRYGYIKISSVMKMGVTALLKPVFY